MADINRPSKEGEQNTDYNEPHRDIPREGRFRREPSHVESLAC